MHYRGVLLFLFAVLAVFGAYYAGYWRGLHVHAGAHAMGTPEAIAMPQERSSSGESERVRETSSVRRAPLYPASKQDYNTLLARDLTMPLDAVRRSDILDTFNRGRPGGKRHEATDIMAPRGTPVHAIDDGTIRKLFLSKAGGNTIYEFDPQGVYCFYYAHLDRYADGLKEGMAVRKGDVIGYVGSTGDADANAPHLHFAIFKLGPDKKWWEGEAINPYPVLIELARR